MSMVKETHLPECLSLCLDHGNDGKYWDGGDGEGGNDPSEPYGPGRIYVFSLIVGWFLVVHYRKHPDGLSKLKEIIIK